MPPMRKPCPDCHEMMHYIGSKANAAQYRCDVCCKTWTREFEYSTATVNRRLTAASNNT